MVVVDSGGGVVNSILQMVNSVYSTLLKYDPHRTVFY